MCLPCRACAQVAGLKGPALGATSVRQLGVCVCVCMCRDAGLADCMQHISMAALILQQLGVYMYRDADLADCMKHISVGQLALAASLLYLRSWLSRCADLADCREHISMEDLISPLGSSS